MIADLFTDVQRERLEKAEARLVLVESGLLNLQAQIPTMAREVAAVREDIRLALGGGDGAEAPSED